MLLIDLEREFQLRAAELSVAECTTDELKAALLYAWRGWLQDRQNAEALLRSSLGVEVSIGGPLLPQALRPLGFPSNSA